MIVVWDGRRNGPGGAHLVTPYEAPRLAPRLRRAPPVETRGAVLAQLARKPHTLRELVAATGCTPEQVNSMVYLLQHEGVVVKVGDRQRPESNYGRTREYVYGIAS